MNARERQLVNNLLAVVDDANLTVRRALDEFSTEMIQERNRQQDEAVEAAYQREDQIDQYRSAMADKYVERSRQDGR